MRKIKLFETSERYTTDYYDEGYNQTVLSHGISNWEEVTDEEYLFIKNNLHLLNRNVIVVEQLDGQVPAFIDSIKKEIDKRWKVAEKRRLEEQKRKEESAEKRRMKKLERDKKALARLISENPGLIEDIKGA